MKVLVLSKRQYTGKDLLDDAFGRFHHLPLLLAEGGHEVRGLCASYRRRSEGEHAATNGPARVLWRARNVVPYLPWSLHGWLAEARRIVRDFRPDVVWACSDAFHAILGVRLQRESGVPCVVDLCDNFEAYGGTRIPGVLPLYRAAVARSAGVTCVSAALRDHVVERYGVRNPVIVLENGVSGEFKPQDRAASRARWKLPADARIVGTAGAISATRGSDVLFDAFLRLAAADPGLHLVFAGPVDAGTTLPKHDRVRYLGALPLADVPSVFGAMDVAVVCNRRSAFGDYCFPQKLYEIIACGVPPLVADTPGVAGVLRDAPRHRFAAGDANALAERLGALLARPGMPPARAVPWSAHGATLARFLESAARPR